MSLAESPQVRILTFWKSLFSVLLVMSHLSAAQKTQTYSQTKVFRMSYIRTQFVRAVNFSKTQKIDEMRPKKNLMARDLQVCSRRVSSG